MAENGAHSGVDFRTTSMINPNSDDFNNNPLPTDGGAGQQAAPGAQSRMQESTPRASEAAASTWDEAKNRAGMMRERTEYYLRENPVPTIVGALVLGLAIGLAIRYASSTEEKEVRLSSRLGDISLKGLALPSLTPWLKSARRKYDEGAEAVMEGVDRLKNVDVDRYVKPVRKRWNAWFD